jgi:hypothetical protein
MIVRQVHTALEHEINGKKQIGSFLYLEELNERDVIELRKLAEGKAVDPRSRAYLDSLESVPNELLAWYLSVDGNYILIRHLSIDWEVQQGNVQSIAKLSFPIEGDVLSILRELRRAIEQEPALSHKIFKNAGVSRGKLTNRIDLARLSDPDLEGLYQNIHNVNPFSDSDDILAYSIIMGREKDQWGKPLLKECREQAARRFVDIGHWNQSIFFDLSKVSLEELDARRQRAQESLVKFNTRFPAANCLDSRFTSLEQWWWEVENYLRGLSDDILVELLLAFFAYSIEESERSKVLLSAISQRLPHNLH